MTTPSTTILSAADVEALLTPDALIDAVEDAFRGLGSGNQPAAGLMAVEVADGVFHIKVAALSAHEGVLAAKLNANFPGNPAANGLPTIQGIVVVCDVASGAPLAVMESGAVTRLRTAAATAVAFRHLAPADSDTLSIVGCGAQSYDQIRFTARVRSLKRITLLDKDTGAAERLATRLACASGADVRLAQSLDEACAASAMLITCTPSHTPFLFDRHVVAGVTVAAVGSDNPHKQELAPALLAGARVVTDLSAQCAAMGELHHALAAGVMRLDSVHAELGAIVAGRLPGRTDSMDRIIFDSTGLAIQDAAAATLAVALAKERALGTAFRFRD